MTQNNNKSIINWLRAPSLGKVKEITVTLQTLYFMMSTVGHVNPQVCWAADAWITRFPLSTITCSVPAGIVILEHVITTAISSRSSEALVVI